MTKVLRVLRYIGLAVLLVLPTAILADNGDLTGPVNDENDSEVWIDLSLDEIAMELSSPVNTLFSIRNDFEYRLYQGSLADADDESAFIYNFQSSVPIPLANGKTIQLRMNIPVNGTQPIYEIPGSDKELSPFLIRQIASTVPENGTFDNSHGHSYLGDVSFDVAYGGVSSNGFISMFGIAVVLPTSQDLSQSIDQYQLGPEIALGKVTDWGLYGAWFKHLTRVAGEDAWDTNMTSLEVFFAYALGNGWQVFSNPVIQYDWEGDTDNKLFLPIGGGISKTMLIGKMPLKFEFEVQKYIASPDSIGPDWLFTFSFTPVFRNPFQK